MPSKPVQSAGLQDEERPEAYCIACGYEITGIDPDGRCPECGFAISESLKPEVRGFGGILILIRFRIGIWLLALLPLIVALTAAAQAHTGFRNLLAQHIFRGGNPQPPWAWRGQASAWHVAVYRLDWACLILVSVSIIATTALLCLRPRALKQSIAISQTTPRWISIRTATIAAGCVLSMSIVAFGLIWDLTGHTHLNNYSIVLSALTLAGLGLLAWWIVALLASGRLRFGMIVAVVMLALAATLEITARLWWHNFDTVARGVAYSGLALIALNAGLLWRWFARGFKRPVLAAIATGYAAIAPIAIAWAGALIDQSLVSQFMGPIRLPRDAMLLLAAVIALISTAIGIVSARSLTGIRTSAGG